MTFRSLNKVALSLSSIRYYLSDLNIFTSFILNFTPGRDSVMALQRRNDLETQPEMTSEEKDADLLQRLEDLLIENQGYFNVESLRESFQKTDKEKAGKLNSKEVFQFDNLMTYNVWLYVLFQVARS